MSVQLRRAALFFVVASTLVLGCGKKDSPTQPGGGGGGGATVEPFDSGTFSSTSSPWNVFVHTFTNEGTFSYRCTIHGGMTGSIMCATGMPESSTVTITNNQFTPSLQHVRPGGYIKWVAAGGNHTVTRP